MTMLDQYLWQLFLGYLSEQNQQSCAQRSFAMYQNLEPYDEEVDSSCVLLFPGAQELTTSGDFSANA